MRRASYREAIEWIASRLPILVDPIRIEQMELAIFVAFLFDVEAARVAGDVTRRRVRITKIGSDPAS